MTDNKNKTLILGLVQTFVLELQSHYACIFHGDLNVLAEISHQCLFTLFNIIV